MLLRRPLKTYMNAWRWSNLFLKGQIKIQNHRTTQMINVSDETSLREMPTAKKAKTYCCPNLSHTSNPCRSSIRPKILIRLHGIMTKIGRPFRQQIKLHRRSINSKTLFTNYIFKLDSALRLKEINIGNFYYYFWLESVDDILKAVKIILLSEVEMRNTSEQWDSEEVGGPEIDREEERMARRIVN